MKKVFFILLFFSLNLQAQEKNSFFYATFSSCKENFYNFNKSKDIETNPSEKNSLVCSEKIRTVTCTVLDPKGKKIREEKMTKTLSVPGLVQYDGDRGMSVTVLKSTGGVFYSLASPSIDSISQTICVGEVKDASDLKNLQEEKEIYKPLKLEKPKTPTPVDDSNSAPTLVGE